MALFEEWAKASKNEKNDALFKFVASKYDLSGIEEQSLKEIKGTISRLSAKLAEKWSDSKRTRDRFLSSNEAWLDGAITFRAICDRSEPSTSDQPPLGGPGRPRIVQIADASSKTKRRRVADLVQSRSSEELLAAAEISSRQSDDFKCTLPVVTSEDNSHNIARFRSDFSKVSEVKFPGLIGPLNEKLICKIKCIDGNWVGPLCSTTPDGRFQPIFRQCLYKNNHPLLTVTYKNSSIEKDTFLPHGSNMMVRCKHFGYYKMKGESTLHCENGEWVPKLPECVPTTVITNFTGDAPPTVLYTILSGSGVVGPTGVLWLRPDSSLRLDCVSPRALGEPAWSWRQPHPHTAAWSTEEGESETHYRLSLQRVTARHSGLYTCSALGHTHTVAIRVVNVSCPSLSADVGRARVFAQGSRLGHAAHYSCPPGFHLAGPATITCMPTGKWSAPAPRCVHTHCSPPLAAEPPLAVVEYNASAGGRAVFQCAWGYRLVGAPGLECGLDGRWSRDMPHCAPIYCPTPIIPEKSSLVNSRSDGKYLVGELLVYSCRAGLQATGETSVVCTEGGFWSHPPPFCLPPPAQRADTISVDNTTLVHEGDT